MANFKIQWDDRVYAKRLLRGILELICHPSLVELITTAITNKNNEYFQTLSHLVLSEIISNF